MSANQPEYLSRIGEATISSRWVIGKPIIFSPIWQEFPQRFKSEKDFQILVNWDLYLHHLDPKKAIEFRRSMVDLIESSTLVSDGTRMRFSSNKLNQARPGLRGKIYQAVLQFFFSTENGFTELLSDTRTPEEFFENPVDRSHERHEIEAKTLQALIPIIVIALIYVVSMMFREPEATMVPNAARLFAMLGQVFLGSGIGFGAGGVVGGVLTKSGKGAVAIGTIGGTVGAVVSSVAGNDRMASMPTHIESVGSDAPEILGLLALFSLASAGVYRRNKKIVAERSGKIRNHVDKAETRHKRDMILQSMSILVLQKLQEIERAHVKTGRANRHTTNLLSDTQIDAIFRLYTGSDLDHISQAELATALTSPGLRPEHGSIQSTGVAAELIQAAEAYGWGMRANRRGDKRRISDVLPSIDTVSTLTTQEKISLAELFAPRYKSLRFNTDMSGRIAVLFDLLPTASWLMMADEAIKPKEERFSEYLVKDGMRGQLLATSGPAMAVADAWYQGVTLAASESQMQLRVQAFSQLAAIYKQVHDGGSKDEILVTPPAIKKAIFEGFCLQAASSPEFRGTGHYLEPFLEENTEPYAKYSESKLDDVALIELFLADTLPSITNPYGSSRSDFESTVAAVRSFRIRYIKKVLDAYLPRDTASLKRILLSSDSAKKFSLVIRVLMESVENESELKLIEQSLQQFNASIDDYSGAIRRSGEFFESTIFSVAIIDVYNFLKKRKTDHDTDFTKRAHQVFSNVLESMISTSSTELIFGVGVTATFPFTRERIDASLFAIPYAVGVLPEEKKIPLLNQLSNQVQAASQSLDGVLLQNQVASLGGAALIEGGSSLDKIIVINKIAHQIVVDCNDSLSYPTVGLVADLRSLSPATLGELGLLNKKGELIALDRTSPSRREEIVAGLEMLVVSPTDPQQGIDAAKLAQIVTKIRYGRSVTKLANCTQELSSAIAEKRSSLGANQVLLRSLV